MTYHYLIRTWGRGRSVAHLIDAAGIPLCGKRLGDRWVLSAIAGRRVCPRCVKKRWPGLVKNQYEPAQRVTGVSAR